MQGMRDRICEHYAMTKELSICHKLKFSKIDIFAI